MVVEGAILWWLCDLESQKELLFSIMATGFGVPWGSILSPMLSNNYMNLLVEVVMRFGVAWDGAAEQGSF